MRTDLSVGIALIIGAPVAFAVSYYFGVILNLTSAIETIVIAIIAAMLGSGGALIWNARKPNEQDSRRKEDIWRAIKLWVELPITRFRDKQDTLPLAEKPPELAVEIEKCLSQKYPSVYACLQKLRQEYHDWKNTDSSARFMKVVEGRTIINLDDVIKWDEFKQRELMRLHSQLVEQIKSEILAKHHIRLKC
jgi:hypothetical protein